MAGRRVDALAAQQAWLSAWEPLRAWISELALEELAEPTLLPGWTVGDLAAHVVRVADSVAVLRPAARGTTALSIAAYVATYAQAADDIAAASRDALGGSSRTPADLALALSTTMQRAIARLESLPGDPVVTARRGPIRLGDFLATRVIDVVVHADDLARSLPGRPVPELPAAGVAMTVQALLGILLVRAPGRSVEVRVPPYAAVQCIQGPRHTRGTPANVVELAARDWIRLAAGRTTWAEEVAAARLSASGERSDISGWLPLL